MKTHLLYIKPLDETGSKLKESLESYHRDDVSVEILSDTEDGICLHVSLSKDISFPLLIWETLREACLDKGGYWHIDCGRNTDLIDFTMDEPTELVEDSEVCKAPEPEPMVLIKNMEPLKLELSERAWRFL